MRKSIFARLMTAVSALVLLALAAAVTAEAFFHLTLTEKLHALLASREPLAVVATLAAILVLVLLAFACLCMLVPARPTKKRGFVMQKSENGPIGISVKAIEGLVNSCVQQQEAIGNADIAIAECRDGINVLLNIDQAAGVNIPLSVGVLQKQIKQYVTACTGVDVHEVRVLVENNAAAMPTSPYAVQDAAPAPAVTPVQEAAPAEPVAEAPAEVTAPAPKPAAEQEAPVPAVPVAVPPMMTAMPAAEEEENERPLHQRLFGAEEQPVTVPAPPEMVIEREEAAEEIAPAEEADESETEPAAEETSAVSEATPDIAEENEEASVQDA